MRRLKNGVYLTNGKNSISITPVLGWDAMLEEVLVQLMQRGIEADVRVRGMKERVGTVFCDGGASFNYSLDMDAVCQPAPRPPSKDAAVATIWELRRIVQDVLKDEGGCDHSVGICVCDWANALERADQFLRKATNRGENNIKAVVKEAVRVLDPDSKYTTPFAPRD